MPRPSETDSSPQSGAKVRREGGVFNIRDKFHKAGEKLQQALADSTGTSDEQCDAGLDIAKELEGMAQTKRLRLRFVGQVQGVGFRWTSMYVARQLGLTGCVRNEDDGSVSMEIQGEASHVGAFFSQMLEQYRRHPISYVVDEREDIPVVEDEVAFEVVY